MAEFVMKDLWAKAGVDGVEVESAAMRTDEIGNDTHRGTKAELQRRGIPFSRRAAWLLTREKAKNYDLIVAMDEANMRDLQRRLAPEDLPKIRKILSFAGLDRDVADPWYTGDFVATYEDVLLGTTAILEWIESQRIR